MARKNVLRAGMYGVATAAFSVAAFAGLTATASAAGTTDVEANSLHGCPSGAVCLYDDAAWANQEPDHMYWSYGPHRLYDEYGEQTIVNNQTGGATMNLCEGSDGTGCIDPLSAPVTVPAYLTPYNSIRLDPA